MSKNFARQDSMRHIRLGKKGRKKWRKPKGRHSKMRKRRKSYPATVIIGYKSPKKETGKIKGLKPILVHNEKELLKLRKDNIAIIAKIGAKKKFELIKFAQEKNVEIWRIRMNGNIINRILQTENLKRDVAQLTKFSVSNIKEVK